MSRLVIRYGGRTVFDADVAEVQWRQDADTVTVTGRATAKPHLGQQLKALAVAHEKRQAGG